MILVPFFKINDGILDKDFVHRCHIHILSHPWVIQLSVQNILDGNMILFFFKRWILFSFSDCETCYNDILAAATDCILSFEWLTCIEDVLGAGNPCIECVCEVIADIGNIFGQDWSCWKCWLKTILKHK